MARHTPPKVPCCGTVPRRCSLYDRDVTEDRRWCPACGLAVRWATMICPVCDSAIGDGVYVDRDPLDAVARLIDPGRQQLTRLLAFTPWPVLAAALAMGLGTNGIFGVASCAILIGLMIVTAPESFAQAAPRPNPRRRSNQAIERQDIAVGPPGAWKASGFQREVGIGMAVISSWFWFGLGILVPAMVLTGSGNAGGFKLSASILLAWVALIVATVFRSRRKSDAEGFTGIGVPID